MLGSKGTDETFSIATEYNRDKTRGTVKKKCGLTACKSASNP